MKQQALAITRFLTIFFFVFGCLEFLFFLRLWIPHLGNPNGIPLVYTRINLVSALVFTAAHSVIASERLDQRISVKTRVLLCSLPCILVCVLLAHYFSIPSLITMLLKIESKVAASIVFITFTAVCAAVWFLCYALVERHYYKIGKTYNAALAAYKKKCAERV